MFIYRNPLFMLSSLAMLIVTTGCTLPSSPQASSSPSAGAVPAGMVSTASTVPQTLPRTSVAVEPATKPSETPPEKK